MYEPNELYEKVWASARPAVREAVEWIALNGSPECPVQVFISVCDRLGLTVKERNLVTFGTDYPWMDEPLGTA